MPTLEIKDFALKPGVRYRSEGPHSGEEYREEVLEPVLVKSMSTGEKITIVLDGVFGYATSFLEEVFGGVVRKYGYDKIKDLIVVVSKQRPYYRTDIEKYMFDAK